MERTSQSSRSLAIRAAFILASGLGSGYSPVAPGTVGTVAATLLWLPVAWFGLWDAVAMRIALSLGVLIIGVWASRVVLLALDDDLKRPRKGKVDPQFIVIDEWAGMLIALIVIEPAYIWQVAAAFFLFRLFDVLKPGPVSMAEKLPGEWGIMLDDVVAGIFAATLLKVISVAL